MSDSADPRPLFPPLAGVGDGATLRFGDGALERGELPEAAVAVAERLVGSGPVAVWARPTLGTAVAVVAGLLAGIPVVPVPEDAGPGEVAHLLRDSGGVAWVGEPGSTPMGLMVVPVDLRDGSSSATSEPDGDSTALILYTSGTTGPPTGVVLSRRALAAGLDALVDAWAWTPGDRLVHGLPLFHVHGLVLGVLGPLRVGCSLVHTGRPDPSAYAAGAGTLYFGVPTVWRRVAREEESAAALRSARLLVSGSAPLPVPVFERLRELTGHQEAERYGMTETLITVAARADRPRSRARSGFRWTASAPGFATSMGSRLPRTARASDGSRCGGDALRRLPRPA